jgi:LCP family protein required for cell wall assembly
MSRRDARDAELARHDRRRSRPERHNQRYGHFLRLTFIGSLIPGMGLIAAGRRVLGGFLLTMFVLLLAAAATVWILVPSRRLASYSGDREMLLYAGVGLTALAVCWLLIALATHRSLEPDDLPAGKRLAGAFVVILAASVVIAPMAVAARSAFTQRDLIAAISAGTADRPSQTTPQIADMEAPWADKPRLNVLLLGADTGKGRDEDDIVGGGERGIRPDTQIVASIDTTTGDTTLISLPRYLGRVPFPDDSPLSEYYPNGFLGPDGNPTNPEYTLNAVYKHVPNLHPDLGISGSDANKWAVEGALGIDIDYYMLVNLDGFEAIVDALGGVTIDVSQRVPIRYGEPDSNCTYRASYIETGEQQMDGSTALMYSRSRCGSDDYHRMERQQCVMKAIVDEADPATLLTRYQSIAATVIETDMVRTDIPEDLFSAIIDLTFDVRDADITSVSIDNELLASMGGGAATPDYDALRAFVHDQLGTSNDDTTATADDASDTSETDEGSTGSNTDAPSLTSGESAADADQPDEDAEADPTC